MKELLDRVLRALPRYLPELGRLLVAPKTAIVQWVETARGDLTHPLVFVGLSVALGFVLQIPRLAKDQDFLAHAASMGAFKLVALVAAAAIIHGLFRLLRGRAHFAATFAAYLYLVSPLYLALLLLHLAGDGIVRAFDPALVAATGADPLYFASRPDEARRFVDAAPGLAWTYGALVWVRMLVTVGWFVACWGAFRALHGVGRWRSLVAGLAAGVAILLCFQVLEFLLLGMFGVRMPPLM